jgi:hypothetical protein
MNDWLRWENKATTAQVPFRRIGIGTGSKIHPPFCFALTSSRIG